MSSHFKLKMLSPSQTQLVGAFAGLICVEVNSFVGKHPVFFSSGDVEMNSSYLSLEEISVVRPVFQYSSIFRSYFEPEERNLQSSSKFHILLVEKLQILQFKYYETNTIVYKSSPVLKP